MQHNGSTDRKFRRNLAAASALAGRPDAPSLPAINRARDPIEKSSKVVRDPEPEGGRGATAAVASPFEEKDVSKRVFHPEAFIVSTDALFILSVTPVQKIIMEDANELETEFIYGDPFNP
jgi:hypothetical protein